jgi:hypothetical protein
MLQELPPHFTTLFVLGSLGLTVSALAYLAKSWVSNFNTTIKELSVNVRDLSQVINELKQEQAVQRVKLRHNYNELRDLQERACVRKDCAYKETSGDHMTLTALKEKFGLEEE